MTGASTEELYARETASLTAARLPALTLAFATVFSVAWLLEYLAHPERMKFYAVIFGAELLVCLAAVLLTRTSTGRRHSVVIVDITCALLCGLIASYHVTLHGETEIMALALVYLVTGITVGLPLGGWGQLPVAIAAVLAYLGAVWLGAVSVTPVPLTALGLTVIGGLSVAGALFLDRYRFASFRQTEELRQANAALAKANAAKNLFLANVSHELRTPLNVILGYTQLILDEGFGPLPAPLRSPLERIMSSTQSLVYLISDLLDLSRVEAGRLAIRLERVDLAPLFEELAAFIRPILAAKPVQFTVNAPRNLTVSADPDRLRQILVNLLSNAAKFTASGEIGLSAQPIESNQVEIAVADTGIGIDRDDLDRIFEPFHRATNSNAFGGVGIGLSISAHLARAMGGDLSVQSEPTQGSRFCIRLAAA
ncbi:MAG TPA: HAMP domain-containing sensor histidine kinase [Candidatus Binatia bacterium]|nr:HAMP domain-containing sensor histidine kinase [Candidatus Binatia bacterium]